MDYPAIPFVFQANSLPWPSLGRAFSEFGLAVIEGFLAPADCAGLYGEVADYFWPRDDSLVSYREKCEASPFARFGCEVLGWNPVEEGVGRFIELRDDPRLDAATTACIGPGYRFLGSLVFWSVRGGEGQAWHQDCPAGIGESFNLNRLFYPQQVELDDGAVVVVPGSHRRGLITAGGHQDSLPGEVVLTPKAGSLILLHGWTWHRVTPNRSARPRTSTNLRVLPRGCVGNPTGIGVYRNGRADFVNGKVVVDEDRLAVKPEH